jgi:hypothetical protein
MQLEHTPCRVYLYRGLTAVPHHTKRNTFVQPGGAEVPLAKLEQIEAPFVTMSLWMRPWAVAANLQRDK